MQYDAQNPSLYVHKRAPCAFRRPRRFFFSFLFISSQKWLRVRCEASGRVWTRLRYIRSGGPGVACRESGTRSRFASDSVLNPSPLLPPLVGAPDLSQKIQSLSFRKRVIVTFSLPLHGSLALEHLFFGFYFVLARVSRGMV